MRRRSPDGAVEALLVHRPAYDDWSLPKGKSEAGETDEAAALREVEEETGLRCSLGREVGSVRYRDRSGRPKVVRYWCMDPGPDGPGGGGETGDPSFVPDAEIDALRWCTLDAACELLTYARDRALLRAALETGP